MRENGSGERFGPSFRRGTRGTLQPMMLRARNLFLAWLAYGALQLALLGVPGGGREAGSRERGARRRPRPSGLARQAPPRAGPQRSPRTDDAVRAVRARPLRPADGVGREPMVAPTLRACRRTGPPPTGSRAADALLSSRATRRAHSQRCRSPPNAARSATRRARRRPSASAEESVSMKSIKWRAITIARPRGGERLRARST